MQEIKERGISITTWYNENNATPSSFYTIKWKNKNKELSNYTDKKIDV